MDNFSLYKERKAGQSSELFLNCHRSTDFGRILISPGEFSENEILFQAIKGFKPRMYCG